MYNGVLSVRGVRCSLYREAIKNGLNLTSEDRYACISAFGQIDTDPTQRSTLLVLVLLQADLLPA